ncbi:MAG: hypothetical protein HKO59_17015 [Phycisphaerales bacterium]|nr:aminotransferase class IV [Phycisphaerae bacterium]NNF42276.1 hypothetical protein [Phycisphaerales bacterium]NNM27651.1 hypothetical protein [Phycisphaerales bacterium]
MHVWLNGEFVDHEEAMVSVFDAGFQHAVGLFETMRAANGRIFRGADHLDRLAASAGELQLTERLRTEALIEAVELAVRRNELSDARVRLTVTGGNLAALAEAGPGGGPQNPTILIVVQPPTKYPPKFFEEGVTVAIADGRLNPLDMAAGHKTLNYWPRIHALQQTARSGAGEAIWFTVTNHLACGSVSNAFLVKDGTLITPVAHREEETGALAAPVLPGITRATIIECAETLGLPVERRQLDIEELLAADEVFLTNSSWGVLPVVRVEQETIGAGTVGATTRRLRTTYEDLVDAETAAPDHS